MKEGTLSVTLHGAGRSSLLWDSEMPLELSPEGTLEMTIPGLGPEEEPVVNLYAWNAETGSDYAGGTVLPSLRPSLRLVRDRAVLEAEQGVLKGYLTIQNETARIEDGLTLSLFLCLVRLGWVSPLGSRTLLFYPGCLRMPGSLLSLFMGVAVRRSLVNQ